MDQIKTGRFIAEQRKQLQMTQKQLADRIGVTDRAVSKWENGRGLPDYAYVSALCDVLDITFDELISGEKTAQENQEQKHRENLEGIYRLFDKIKRKNSRILTIAVCAGLLFILTGGAFVVDALRMIQNRPVIFSRWGTDYTPSINLEKEKMDIAIRNFCLKDYEEKKEREGYSRERVFVETNTFHTEGKDREYYAYTWVFLESFGIKNEKVELISGYSGPERFTLRREEEGNYEVVNVEIPRDGTLYESSLKELFPAEVLKEIEEFSNNGSVHRMKLLVEEQKDLWYSQLKNTEE